MAAPKAGRGSGWPGRPLPPARRTRARSQAGDWLGKRWGVPATAPCAPGREGPPGQAPHAPSPVPRPEGGRKERAQREGPRSRVGKPAPRSAPGCLAVPTSAARGRGQPGEGGPRGGRGRAKGGPVRRAGTDWTRRGWLPRCPAAGSGKPSSPPSPGAAGSGEGRGPRTQGTLTPRCGRRASAARVWNCGPLWGSNCWEASPSPR